MRDLLDGMDAGIGAAGADHSRRHIGDDGQCGFDRILNRPATGLRLPAAEGRTVVLDAEGVSHASAAISSSAALPMAAR